MEQWQMEGLKIMQEGTEDINDNKEKENEEQEGQKPPF